MTSSELEVVSTGLLKLASSGASFDDVIQAMLDGTEPLPSSEKGFPAIPAPAATLSGEARAALLKLIDSYGLVSMTTGGQPCRRQLSEAELGLLGEEDLALRTVFSLLEGRKKAIGEMLRTHADVTAEKDGTAGPDTPRDPAGHYLHASKPKDPYRIQIPGTGKSWSLEFHGGAILYDDVDLARMHADREITDAEFRAITRRVFDPAKAAAFMLRQPARALQIMRKITRTGTPSNYLYVRKSK